MHVDQPGGVFPPRDGRRNGRPASGLAAALLAVFLGDVGAHNFYLRQFIRGALHVLFVVLGVALLLQGSRVSAGAPSLAGIPPGADWYVAGLVILGANGLWRWVELVVILATPAHRLGR